MEVPVQNSFFALLFLVLISSCVKGAKTSAPKETDQTNTQTNTPTSNPTPSPTPITTPAPNNPDPLYFYAWHLDNSGQKNFADAGGTIDQDLNIVGARNLGRTGSGVRIAVSDTGLETAHEDLFNNLLAGEHRDYTKASAPFQGDPNPSGDAGDHGTSVSGIIGAVGNNGIGSQGIAYGAKLAGFKYIAGTNTLSRMLDQADGNFDIFNFSYGLYSCIFSGVPSEYIDQLKFGVNNLRAGKGAIYVKAAGNEYIGSTSDCFPSETNPRVYYGNANLEEDHSYPYQIVVAAVNANGVSSSYSTPGSSVWISAPGGEYGNTNPAILTTDRTGCDKGYAKTGATRNDFEDGDALNQNCNYTSVFNGTSSATPMISGVTALMLEANPNLSWRDVKHILATTARKTDPARSDSSHPGGLDLPGHVYQQGWRTNAAGFNFHNWYGFGAADAGAAVSMAASYQTNWGIQQETNFVPNSGTIDISIPDEDAGGATSDLSVNQNLIIEAVQIKISIEHSFIGDLGVELTSPSGTKSILMNINSSVSGSAIVDEVLLSNAFYGEPSFGQWSLKIVDGYAQDVGKLTNWKLNIIGH
ncbi:MAG: subtilisin-like proprotein convertase family protein [Bacteriovoracaceae bacterium]|jgi:subtilisin-like proprotein convertase family protein